MYAATEGRDTGPHPGPAPSTAGPHRHDIMNKLDPTVDSQHGGVQVLGPGVNATASGSDNPAPRGSHLREQLDPRVSSQAGNTVLTGSTAAPGVAAPGVAAPGVAAPGVAAPGVAASGMSGPPSFNTRQPFNAQNPTRGVNNRDTYTEPSVHDRQPSATQNPPGTVLGQADGVIQPGPAPNTAGPHRHDVMNKLDPTVNSKAAIQQQSQYRTA